MKIIGCDFHPSFQQIAMVDTETGEQTEKKLTPGEAVQFYSQLRGPVLVGMEACGNTLWFERLQAQLGHQLWLGDAGKIRALEVRKQKTDRRDAELLLQLLLEKRFPRIWVPSPEQRDLRQLLLHRHKLVGMRRQVKNQLQHLALNQGVQQKHKLWTAAGRKRLEEVALTGWTAQRREELLLLLDDLEPRIGKLDPGGAGSGGERPRGPEVADPSRSRTDYGAGVFAYAGRDRTICAQPASGELPGAESGGAFQRRPAATGIDQQARQSDVTQSVGRGGPERGPSGTRVEARLSAAETQKTFFCGQGDGGAQTGGAAVLDVEKRAAVFRHSHAGQPESSCGCGLKPCV
jgi:hypothetical protein